MLKSTSVDGHLLGSTRSDIIRKHVYEIRPEGSHLRACCVLRKVAQARHDSRRRTYRCGYVGFVINHILFSKPAWEKAFQSTTTAQRRGVRSSGPPLPAKVPAGKMIFFFFISLTCLHFHCLRGT